MRDDIYKNMTDLLDSGTSRAGVRNRLSEAASRREITWVEASEVLVEINRVYGPEDNPYPHPL